MACSGGTVANAERGTAPSSLDRFSTLAPGIPLLFSRSRGDTNCFTSLRLRVVERNSDHSSDDNSQLAVPLVDPSLSTSDVRILSLSSHGEDNAILPIVVSQNHLIRIRPVNSVSLAVFNEIVVAAAVPRPRPRLSILSGSRNATIGTHNNDGDQCQRRFTWTIPFDTLSSISHNSRHSRSHVGKLICTRLILDYQHS